MKLRARLTLLPVLLLVAAAGAVHAADPNDPDRLRETLACEECDLRRADPKHANLAGARLAGASLSDAELKEAVLWIDLHDAGPPDGEGPEERSG